MCKPRYIGNKAAKKLLIEKQGLICCYCECELIEFDSSGVPGADIPDNQATIEHLRRKADGGTNAPDNLALACRKCNRGRGDIDWLTYKCYKTGEITL